MTYPFIRLNGCKFQEGQREEFLSQQHLLLSLHITSVCVGSSPVPSQRMIEAPRLLFFFFNFFDSSLLRCEVPLLNFSTVEHKQMRKCSDIGTCWWELEESRPNEMRLRGDAVHTKSSKPHHIIFTWQQQSKWWDGERSKGWAWENKSGAKFGVTVTAEGKKGNLEGGETKLAFFSFCLQTARRGRKRGTVAFCSKTSFAWKCVRS